MKKNEALKFITEKKGYVPYITLFEIYGEDDEIPQGLIDLEVKEDRTPCNFMICNAEVARVLNDIKNSQ